MLTTGHEAADHAELHDAVRQRLLSGLAGDQVEAPAVRAGLELLEVEVPVDRRHVRVAGVLLARGGVVLEEAVEHHLVAVLVGVDPVQDVGGVGLEPLRLAGAVSPDDGEPTRHVPEEPGQVDPLGQEIRVPEQR